MTGFCVDHRTCMQNNGDCFQSPVSPYLCVETFNERVSQGWFFSHVPVKLWDKDSVISCRLDAQDKVQVAHVQQTLPGIGW